MLPWIKKIAKSLYAFFKDMSRHNSAAFAASVAFFFFMSLFPTLMFMFSLFTYLPLTSSDILEVLGTFVPASMMGTVNVVINDLYRYSSSLIPITAIATLWTANMGMMGLIRGLNGVLDIEDNRNYFILRGFATFYTIIMLIALIISLILLGFGRRIAYTLLIKFPHLSDILNMFLVLRLVILFIVLALLFALIYKVLPAQKQNFTLCLPGAFIASAGWIIVTLAFSIYINYFNGFSIYGNLTAIMILLFWMYMCFNILIAGAFLNKYYKASIDNRYKKYKTRKLHRKEEKRKS